MFRLGRRNTQFRDRYNRIGSGQRMGVQPAEDEPIDEETAVSSPSQDPDSSDRDGEIGEHVDLDCGSGSASDDAASVDCADEQPGGNDSTEPAEPESPAQGAVLAPDTDPFVQDEQQANENQGAVDLSRESGGAVRALKQALPTIHANGHDYFDGEDALPAWLDSFDPEMPQAKPPELPQYQARAPVTAGKRLDASPLAGDGRLSVCEGPAPRPNKPVKAEAGPAGPVPAWLDTAHDVEMRPPPMAFDATAVPPVDAVDQDHADPAMAERALPIAESDCDRERRPGNEDPADSDPVDGEAVGKAGDVEPEPSTPARGVATAVEKPGKTGPGLPRESMQGQSLHAVVGKDASTVGPSASGNVHTEPGQSVSRRPGEDADRSKTRPSGTMTSAETIAVVSAKVPLKAIAPPMPLPPPL